MQLNKHRAKQTCLLLAEKDSPEGGREVHSWKFARIRVETLNRDIQGVPGFIG